MREFRRSGELAHGHVSCIAGFCAVRVPFVFVHVTHFFCGHSPRAALRASPTIERTPLHLHTKGTCIVSFDFADPIVMLCAWTVLIVTCAAFDAPAISAALRFFRLKWRLAYCRSRAPERRPGR